MQFIRIADKDWDTVWWELVSTGPVSLVSKDRTYAISDRQLDLLKKKRLPFELVEASKNGSQKNGKLFPEAGAPVRFSQYE